MASKIQLEQYLVENDNEPFYIQQQRGIRISKWALYPKMTVVETIISRDLEGKKIITNVDKKSNLDIEYANQVQILKSWVIFDIDPPKTCDKRDIELNAERQMNEISLNLQKEQVNHELYNTGNTGRHILVKYPELNNYSPSDRMWLKRELIRRYADGYDIDLLKTSSKTMIQMPNTPHRKTGKDKFLIKTHTFKASNSIPNSLIMELNILKVGNSLKKKDSFIGKNFANCDVLLLPCIKRLESEKVSEGSRMTALFALLNHWKIRCNEQEIWERGYDFITKHDYFISTEQLKKQINSVLKSTRRPTCRFTKKIFEQQGWEITCPICKDS